MKKFALLPVIAALAVSCSKPQSDAEKNAQIEREVQQRLAAQHQADEQEHLAQQRADLDAREKALSEKEATATVAATATAAPRVAQEREDRGDREAPRSYETFYRKLEPYGTWRETNDYGYVWQPREAQRRDWRPYTSGRWAYTDAGWTWVSEEPFGWATYHYGRWTRLQNVGWVWVPGDEWAPAWVSWRKGDRNVGWAPLPPEARFERNTGIKKWADSYYDISADEYVFIPNEDIGSDRLEQDVIPVERNVTIVNETTNVTNITYNNSTVVNEGPSFDELRGHSRRPIERMRLERRYDVQSEANPHATVQGSIISMVAPIFNARPAERPPKVGEPIRDARVEHNWTNNANQPEAERARQKMRSEATPPPNAPPKRFRQPGAAFGTPPQATISQETTPAPTAAPAATVTATATVTPRPHFTPSTTPVPAATAAASPTVTATATIMARPPVRPRMTPRPVPVATPTPAPAASSAPAVEPTNSPAETTATPVRNFVPRKTARPPRPEPSAAAAAPAETPASAATPETSPTAATATPENARKERGERRRPVRGEGTPTPSRNPEP